MPIRNQLGYALAFNFAFVDVIGLCATRGGIKFDRRKKSGNNVPLSKLFSLKANSKSID